MATRKTTRRTAKAKRKKTWRGLKIAFLLLFSIFGIVFVAGSVYWAERLQEADRMLPNLEEMFSNVRQNPTQIVSADGVTLYTLTSEFRDPVSIEEIPQHVIDATLAAEDKRFYQHKGVDGIALGRAAYLYVFKDEMQGASTLTMQLSYNLFTSREVSIERKLKDMALATMLERRKEKDQILELYLNHVFYGQRAYGIGAAADVYFGKELDDLTIGEAALLARCVRRPGTQNPYTNPEKALDNRRIVLNIMREEQMITEAEYQAAMNEPLQLREEPLSVTGGKRAPYFVDYVMSELRQKMPEIPFEQGGYRIETTLNYEMHKMAQEEVRQAVANNASRRVTTGAMVILDREGQIKAMVGGVDYNRTQYNAISQGARQPGSAFKPLVYATGFELKAFGPSSTMSTGQYVYDLPGGRKHRVSGGVGSGGGALSVQSALTLSNNQAALWAIDEVGPVSVVNFSRQVFGLTNKLEPYSSIALGANAVNPLEMAGAYSIFMTGGDRLTPYGIRRIVGPRGTTVRRFDPDIRRNVLSRDSAKAMDYILRQNVRGGTGSRANNVINGRGKTGTTNDFVDAWFCGYTDRLVGIVWVSNEQIDANGRTTYPGMRGVMGSTVPVPLWGSVMSKAQQMVGEQERTITRDYASWGGGQFVGKRSGLTADDEQEEDEAEVRAAESINNGGRGTANPDELFTPLDDQIDQEETVPPLRPAEELLDEG